MNIIDEHILMLASHLTELKKTTQHWGSAFYRVSGISQLYFKTLKQ